MSKNSWGTEPDIFEFEHLGYTCLILRHESMGHLCGYMQVTKGHPLFEVDYSAIDCCHPHGGVTYSGYVRGDKNEWSIGFDCAHAGDLIPSMAALGLNSDGVTYRDIDYVSEEIKRMVENTIEYVDTLRAH